MGKKHESESSSDSSDVSSSEDERASRKKVARKHKQSANDSESDQETKSKKSRRAQSSDESEDEKSRSRKSKQSKHSEEKDVEHKYMKHDTETKYTSKHTSDKDKSKPQDDYDIKYRKDNNSKEKYDKRDYGDKSRNKERREDYRDNRRDKYDERDNRQGERSGGDRYRSNDRYKRDDNRNSRYNEDRRGTEERPKRNDFRRRRSSSFDHANAKWGKPETEKKSDKKEQQPKQKPNFGLSGKLTEETNTYRGVVIKYSEPPEARKPRRRWRLYPFKGEKALQTLYIHRESAYLIGRDRKVVDLPVDHPSCSKQHAALQYRLVPFTRENGSVGKRVRPYLIDLESANGTLINNKKIEPKKYYELMEKDVIKFGFSSREYVLLHENSKDEALDDDVKLEEEEEEVKVKKEN